MTLVSEGAFKRLDWRDSGEWGYLLQFWLVWLWQLIKMMEMMNMMKDEDGVGNENDEYEDEDEDA